MHHSSATTTIMENIIYTIPLNEFTDIIKKCIREEMSASLPTNREDELIKATDAAKILGVSKLTLFKWRKAGIIPYHRIASRIYFKKRELIEALNTAPKYRRRNTI